MAATRVPPIAGHRWIPTPTIGRGGTKDGNHNLACSRCRERVTKQQLINDEVPPTCERAQRKAA